MNKRNSLIFLFIAVGACFLCIFISRNNQKTVEVLDEDLRFCESVLSHDGGLLIANFGGDALNPLNQDGKGYINYYKDGKMERFIEADGTLSAPKGMMVIKNKLYIADVNKVVVYNIDKLEEKPYEIQFPEGEVFVNHLRQVGSVVLASVTNTGNIYAFDINGHNMPQDTTLKVYTNIPGANGMSYVNSVLYIASYPADGKTTDDNQIYQITDFANPVLERITSVPGHYDGLALVGNDLFYTDWQTKGLGVINLESKVSRMITKNETIDGPAEIDLFDGKVAVPDLVNSKVYLYEIDKLD